MGTGVAVALGVLQGITEFIPVSSSGHLALVRSLLGYDVEPGITFEIVVHFGSFCSIAVYFRRRLAIMIRDLGRAVRRSGLRLFEYRQHPSARLSLIIAVSMVPAVVVGLSMKRAIEQAFVNPVLVASMLLITGAMLFSTRYVQNPVGRITLRNGFLIGVAQAFAILPGISRSGSTITAGLWVGVNRDELAEFSFLMVLPVLAGAMLLETAELLRVGEPIELASLTAGFLASFVTGYLALSVLIVLLKRAKLHLFAYYCWVVAVTALLRFLTA